MANIDSVKLPNGNEYSIVSGSQPNLLTNGWFTVNQRGVSSGSGNTYIADRWSNSNSGNESISRDSNNVITSLCYYADTWFLRQANEYNPSIMGKRVTLSAIINGDIYSFTFDMPQSVPGSASSQKKDLSINGVALRVYFDTTRFICGVFHTTVGNTTVTIKAIKLEIGSTSTLHLDTAPDYSTELLKCQRYYIRYTAKTSNSFFAFGAAINASSALAFISVSSPMRTTPTIGYTGLQIQPKLSSGISATINSAYSSFRTDYMLTLSISFSGGSVASGDFIALSLASIGDYLELDAEL